ncbi:MAG: cystathionine gamma-synthase [Bdellovibrionales bacterium]|nr:cystathionine gamma-synthase [Bdellovibrionales bacterium]
MNSFNKNKLGFETRAIHVGQEPDPTTGAVMTPIYLTSTYVQESPGQHKGYEYSRTKNPTRYAYEQCLASLENGKYGFAFASGCSATTVALHLLSAGDEVIAGDDMYGGTFRLFDKVLSRHGIQFNYVDMTSVESVQRLISKKTKMIWLETPTNPTLKIFDIEKISALAKNTHILLAVDNTFMSPYFQRPLDLGADMVVHSTTKYINGHSDVVGGAIVTRSDELAERLGFLSNSLGPIASPMDSYLALRSLKTLSLRMKAHQQNAFSVVHFLKDHAKIEKVIYPGLESHPQFAIAKKQMHGFGGMISMYVKGGMPQAKKFLEKVRLFSLAESLGGVESLIGHPASMTHASIPIELRKKLGIDDNLIRLSVGIETDSDLIADLQQALEHI